MAIIKIIVKRYGNKKGESNIMINSMFQNKLKKKKLKHIRML
jgi:hypothetical protein